MGSTSQIGRRSPGLWWCWLVWRISETKPTRANHSAGTSQQIRIRLTSFSFPEFKEIRKEWKARKKEEEAQRKAEEERQRQAAAAAAQNGGPDGQPGPDQPPTSYPGSRPVQLPPIAYQQQTQYPAPPGSAGVQQPLPEYGGNYMHPNYQPASPYGQPNQQMYSQRQ